MTGHLLIAEMQPPAWGYSGSIPFAASNHSPRSGGLLSRTGGWADRRADRELAGCKQVSGAGAAAAQGRAGKTAVGTPAEHVARRGQ